MPDGVQVQVAGAAVGTLWAGRGWEPFLDVYALRIYTPPVITWGEPKRRRNLKKHGFDFSDAEQVFEGVTYTYEDDRLA